MPGLEFFARLGLFVRRDFLSPADCSRIHSEMRNARRSRATVFRKNQELLDEGSRRTKLVEVSGESVAQVRSLLRALLSELGAHFRMSFSDCEVPQFLAYEARDFFRAHRDGSDSADANELMRERKVSVVIFLNTESDHPAEGSYTGGALTIYGLLGDARSEAYGFPMKGEQGALVAFRSNLLHEVTPVQEGERYTIACWFY